MRRSLCLALAVLAFGCAEIEKKSLSSGAKTSNVPVEEDPPGVVVGTFSKDASGTQTMVASSAGALVDVFLDVPPGSLALDAKITMGEAQTMIGQNVLPAELGANRLVKDGFAPIYLNDDQGQNLAGSLALNIPLPTDSEDKFTLADTASKLAILYVVRTETGYKIGLYPLASTDFKGLYVSFAVKGFGYFQIVGFAEPVEAMEVAADAGTVPKLDAGDN